VGKKGFDATVARHWQGDRQGYVRWLRERGWLKQLTDLFDAECLERTARGEPGPFVLEIPMLPEEELDENPVVASILASIRSAPIPECPL
jgi:hypothetical protein